MINTILNIARGITNYIRFHLSKSYRMKTEQLFNHRLFLCKVCPNLNSRQKRCSICGCFIEFKTKVHYKMDTFDKSIDGCPKKYW